MLEKLPQALGHALRRVSGDDGAVGMVAVDEDFFVLVRVVGPGKNRWPLIYDHDLGDLDPVLA